MNLAALNEMAEKLKFEDLVDALENLPFGERNLEDRFLRDVSGEILSGLIQVMTQRFAKRYYYLPLIREKENLLLKKILDYATKKPDGNIATIAEGWRNLDPEDFINYLVGFINFDNSLKKGVAFCEVIIKSLSGDTAKSWLKTLERLDSHHLNEQQYLVCYLLRARLRIDRHLHTAYRELLYSSEED